MNFLQTAKERYTTKKYDVSKKIPQKDIDALQETLHLSPSSINSQPWHFTFVNDENTKKLLAEVSFFNASKILNCSHLVVFSVISSIEKFENQIQENIPAGAVGYYNTFLKPKTEQEIKNWFTQQVYLSLGVFLSACATMKIDATPMEGIEIDKYDEILQNTTHKTLVAVAIGYRDVNDANQPSLKPKSRLDLEKVIRVI